MGFVGQPLAIAVQAQVSMREHRACQRIEAHLPENGNQCNGT
jgi:hypothetical protein